MEKPAPEQIASLWATAFEAVVINLIHPENGTFSLKGKTRLASCITGGDRGAGVLHRLDPARAARFITTHPDSQ